MGADCSFYVKHIETHARAFLPQPKPLDTPNTETQYLAATLHNLKLESIIFLHALSITKAFIQYTTNKYHVNQLQIY